MSSWQAHLPPETEEVNEMYLDEFFRTMYERQEIWYKRFILKQSRPWTKNETFSKYKFCNVYRELDRTSQWLIKNVIRNDKLTIEEIIFKILVFRVYNKPETFELIGLPDYKTFDAAKHLKSVREATKSMKVLNDEAYKINTYMSKGAVWESYTVNFIPAFHDLVRELVRIITKAKDAVEVVNTIMKVRGIGTFFSHECYIDLCYLNRYRRDDLFRFNENDYTNTGPGAIVGMRWLFPSLKSKKELMNATVVLKDIAPEYLSKFGDFKYLYWNLDTKKYYCSGKFNLKLHQIEFWLCEYNKYRKMKLKLGKQRSVFSITSTQI